MVQRKNKHFWKKAIGRILVFTMCISGMGLAPGGQSETKASETDAIPIASAQDLAKIGVDESFPMSGDYELTADIDLSGEKNWTPIGGGVGTRGAYSGNNVFTGTFDGNGHIISNLTIDQTGNSTDDWQYGLFGMIGSADSADKASVSNLILTGVDVTVDYETGYLSLGGLAGEINQNAVIENVAIMDGSIEGNPSGKGDVVGVGGLVGEMRPNSPSDNGVIIRNVYVGADVRTDSSTSNNYVAGIVGRVAKACPESVSSCVYAGTVNFKDGDGYGISGMNLGDSMNDEIRKRFTNCYYHSGFSNTGTQVSEDAMRAGELFDGLDAAYWVAEPGVNVILKQCAESEGLSDILALSAIAVNLAKGDTYSSVTQNFTVSVTVLISGKEEKISWSSSNPDVLSVAADGTVTVNASFGNVPCTLTATTDSGKTKEFSFLVSSNISLGFAQEYAKVGEQLSIAWKGLPSDAVCTYAWMLDGKLISNAETSYTPLKEDLQKMLTVTASVTNGEGQSMGTYEAQMYISRLPVVYINTNDNLPVSSKKTYKGATMRIQGNNRYNSNEVALYDGDIEIRGRGNSTWNQALQLNGKLPYKIKLDKKTDLFGFGENKHWAFLANYMDESLLRNKTSYDLAGEMGIEPHLESANVEMIFNGKYAGNYQLVGNVRVQTGTETSPSKRVDVFNWEDAAEDVAGAIADAANVPKKDARRDKLEDELNENMQWITSDKVTFEGVDYQVSKLYPDLPKTSEGLIDVSGGFLFELDGYYDEVSKFRTQYNQPIMFKTPEFIRPTQGQGEGATEWEDNSKNKCEELYQYASQFIQAFEDSVHSPDYYIDVAGKEIKNQVASDFSVDYEGKQHYSDLVDMDSLVSYMILNEFYWNTELMKKSTYMYKDLGEKMKIGPVWDMDWTSNSIVSQDETWDYSKWVTATRKSGSFQFQEQKESWYRYLIGDPYFVEMMYECYWRNRDKFENIVKEGGILDTEYAYLKESGDANYNLAGSLYRNSGGNADFQFEKGVNRLHTFLNNRLNWMDGQFGEQTDSGMPNEASVKETLDALLNSFGKYQNNQNMLSVQTSFPSETETTYTATVSDASIVKAGFYVNGKFIGSADVVNGTAAITEKDGTAGLKKNIANESYVNNVVVVRALDSNGNLVTKDAYYNDRTIQESVSSYNVFRKQVKADALTGTVSIGGFPRVGFTLKAEVADTNNTGTLHYKWMTTDGTVLAETTSNAYRLTEEETGKQITVVVTSDWETGEISCANPTEAVQKVVVENDHVIINQVYGGGANDSTPVSHSFIELYNPTDAAISLDGYSIGYLSNGKNGNAPEEVKLALDGAGIPSHTSYLIRCEKQDEATFAGNLTIDSCDKEWEQAIDNKKYKITLYHGEGIEDGVAVNEGEQYWEEGEILPDGTISKQKAIRRVEFADTNNNVEDFEVIEYKGSTEIFVQMYRPRSLSDGAWEAERITLEKFGISIRGNAIVGATLYADDELIPEEYTNILSYQWKADGKEISGNGQFLAIDESLEGKIISVTVTSTDPALSGSLTASMEKKIQKIAPQRDHLMINQIYGSGENADVPVSHNFIELYNPTGEEVDVSNYSLEYFSNGKTSDGATKTIKLTGTIPSRASYLVLCKATGSAQAVFTVEKSDLTWEELLIDNKQYCVILKNGEEKIDGVSVGEAETEGAALEKGVISKNKSLRRIGFVDTDQNTNDFETLNYSKLPQDYRSNIVPRRVADGAWGLEALPVEPVEPEKPDEKLLQEARDILQEAEETDASKFEENSYQNMERAKQELQAALETNDADKIKEAIAKLRQALEDLEEIEVITPPQKPGEELLQKVQNALKEAEGKDASKFDPVSYQKLTELKNALILALETEDAEKIRIALELLQQALKELKPLVQNQPEPSEQTELPAVGTKFIYNKNWYRITKSAASGGTVIFLKPEKKTQKNVTIPKQVEFEKIKFNVTAIAARAFKNNKRLGKVVIKANITEIGASAFQGSGKLKNIIISSKVLKKVGSNALKGVNAKCKIKVPKNKVKAYTKKFKKKGQKSTVRVVK